MEDHRVIVVLCGNDEVPRDSRGIRASCSFVRISGECPCPECIGWEIDGGGHRG